MWQDGNDNLVDSDTAQGVVIVIVGSLAVDLIVFLVEKFLGCDVLCMHCANPANCIIFGFGHVLDRKLLLAKEAEDGT